MPILYTPLKLHHPELRLTVQCTPNKNTVSATVVGPLALFPLKIQFKHYIQVFPGESTNLEKSSSLAFATPVQSDSQLAMLSNRKSRQQESTTQYQKLKKFREAANLQRFTSSATIDAILEFLQCKLCPSQHYSTSSS